MQASLNRRLLQLALIPALAFALLLTLFFALTLIWQSQREFSVQTEALTRAAVPAILTALRLGDDEMLDSAGQDVLNAPHARSVVVLSSAGELMLQRGSQVELAGEAAALTADTRGPARLLRVDERPWQRIIVPLQDSINPEQPVGWLQVDYSTNDLALANYRLISIGALVALAGVGLIWLLVLMLSRPITLPFYQVMDTLRELSEGRLSQRVKVTHGGDLRALGEGINQLAAALENARDEMQHSVDQATQDLRETLETLEIQNIQLSTARRQAMEANEAKTQFLANMSHEIRTPLNGVIGFIKLLDRTGLTQKQKDYVSTIRQSSESLLVIINDILDFLKLDAGKLELERRNMNLRDLVEDVLDMLAPMAQEKSLELVALVYEDVPLQVIGDPLRLRQVITNLVNNAIKFTDKGHVVVRIASEGQSSSRHRIRLAVSDTGPGIARDKQRSLFRAFNQADASTSRRFGGTGLGLVICQRLVQRMGGKIEVESVEGDGSTFAVLIDFELAEDTVEATLPEASPLAGVEAWYWEPQELASLSLQHHLERWGMSVQALDAGTPPDLAPAPPEGQRIILLTWQPEHHDWLHTFARRARDYGVPVLLLTRHNDHSEALRELEQLASGTVNKPVRQNRLQTLCIQALQTQTGVPIDTPPRLPRILVVDDNKTNRKLLVAFLADFGIQPEEAEDGSEAMARISQHDYDLVFMDIQMPVMDGVTATREIRRHELGDSHLPVVALTAHALPQEQEELMRSGFDDYLTKPVSEQQLVQTIRRWTGADLHPPGRLETLSETPEAEAAQATSPADVPVDFRLGLQRAGNKPALARDMFQGLLDQLHETRGQLAALLADGDLEVLLERVHALHGVTRYCGTPELETRLSTIEHALKEDDQAALAPALQELLAVMDRLLHWSEQEDWAHWLEEARSPAS